MKIRKSLRLEGPSQILENLKPKQLQASLGPKIKETNPLPRNSSMLNSKIVLYITILRLSIVMFIKRFGMCNAESKRPQLVKFSKPKKKLNRKLLLS